MFDFVQIVKRSPGKSGCSVVEPEFMVSRANDLMVRGKSFYAVWNEEMGLWSKDDQYIVSEIDRAVRQMVKESVEPTSPKYMRDFSSKKYSEWLLYCKSISDNYHDLDNEIKFKNSEVRKEDYCTRRLDYNIGPGDITAYEELMSTLYGPEERRKLEWAIGSVIAGDSKKIQKFIVLYGGPGTGKSTILNIIEMLFPGYYTYFESKAIGSSSNQFAVEMFRDNPLIAIEHDGDLSNIVDNTKLNSIISHETMPVNEKYKSTYAMHFNSFIFIATNKPVRITDSKSGLLRRLIDVNPSGELIAPDRYDTLMKNISFELGAIAQHCLDTYLSMGDKYYNGYIPSLMMSETNDTYNFIEDNYDFFTVDHPDYVTLKMTWMRYKEYCVDANVKYILTMRKFGNELKDYFYEYHERRFGERSVYIGFKKDAFFTKVLGAVQKETPEWLDLKSQKSLLDDLLVDCPAQYATSTGVPSTAWDNCKTTLKDLATEKEHYVRPPINMIVIDFDLKDLEGNKSYGRNIDSAANWPQTYAECSKSGSGIHLHYWYEGDVTELGNLVSKDIEVKVFSGKSALRRRLSLCNNQAVTTISAGLPIKEAKKQLLNDYTFKSEKELRRFIIKNLKKEIWPNTKPSVDFIYNKLEECYQSGLHYDVTDMRGDIQQFALGSTHQADACLRLVSKMKFRSEEPSENIDNTTDDVLIVFYDVEVFPNLFLVSFKKQGKENKAATLINPKPSDIEDLCKFRLIGFNNRDYDNHMLYARMMGYTESQLFDLSQKIVGGKEKFVKFGEAYNLSYTDVYDFLSAQNKMSLKKWEIKLGIHHHELGYRWDEPVPEDKWQEVADYCCDDVYATEAVFDTNQADWLARKILAKLSGLTVNDTTNQHSIKIIVGDDPNPQSQFVYTDLSTIYPGYEFNQFGIDPSRYTDVDAITSGKSIYKGEDPGEGGYVYAEPGYHENTPVDDAESMHPSSAIALKIFGEKYTKRFEELKSARIYIKHEEYDKFAQCMDGKLAEFLEDEEAMQGLPDALKTVINSVYGLTSAKFPNKLRDPRNLDNIVAKYGALFMINLKEEVRSRGFTVAHIKTDSIKIPNATKEILDFVSEYGGKYGFKFAHEATYSKMCLVNDAVYIAKYASEAECMRLYGYIPSKQKPGKWTATGAQFKEPYVFKTLFSHEDLEFKDYCQTFSVKTALYLDMNEDDPDNHDYQFVGKVGEFCPIKAGHGGGVLLRQGVDKNGNITYSAATGSKGYRWLESEKVRELHLEEEIDISYYEALANDAIETINKYVDFEKFVTDEPDEVAFEKIMNAPVWDINLP